MNFYIYKLNCRESRPLYGASVVSVFVLLFSFSIFKGWSLKPENDKKKKKKNSVEPDQMPQHAASDQGLNYLHGTNEYFCFQR